jgi:hypothetical protein
MRQRITNICALTFDVLRFIFESAGALEIANEYPRYAVAPARYIAFAELKQRTSHVVIRSLTAASIFEMLDRDGLFACWLPIASTGCKPRTFSGSASAGSTCWPSSGLLCNRSWSAPSKNARFFAHSLLNCSACGQARLVIRAMPDHGPSDSCSFICHGNRSNNRVTRIGNPHHPLAQSIIFTLRPLVLSLSRHKTI